MGGSSEKVAAAFEFDEEEELMEATSEKLMAKFQPKNHDHALDKYNFLQHFTSDSDMKQTTMDSVMCIDIHEADDVAQSYASGLTEENIAYSVQRTQLNGIVGISTCYSEHGHITSVGMGVNTDSDEEEANWNSQSEPSSSPCSDDPEKDEYMEDMASDDFHNTDREMDQEGEVFFRPDFITCGTTLYVEPLVTFSPAGIKLETRDSDYDEEISMEWKISDIIYINCKWTESAEGVSVKILLQADYNDISEKERFVKVSFYVSDMYWDEKEHKIRNLTSRYEEIWNAAPLTDDDGNNMDPALFFPKYYFSGISQNFEDVIYPKGDPDAVSISKRDVDLLLPETFINDTIIDFYIKYLSKGIPGNRKQRLHFFNSFFFRKLADLDKDPGKAAEGRAAFLRVRKWTRKFNIFDKDFIFIPVNFNLHWSLLVICHPGDIVELQDDVLESPKIPCILHMDSLKGSHSGLKDIIQSYLWEEWKERHPESNEDHSSKFLNLRFVSLELPQQENCFDCGLFLLHYVERFLEDSPSELNPFVITKYSSFLTPEWFPPSEASLKRSLIRILIYNLLHETCQNDGIVANASSNGCSQNNGIDLKKETGVELLCQSCCPSETVGSPVYPVDISLCPVTDTRNGDGERHKVREVENVLNNITERMSQCQQDTSTQIIEAETCIIVDEEEDKLEEKPSTIPNKEEEPDGNHSCGPSSSHVWLKSVVVCNSDTRNVLDINGVLEDSSRKGEIMKDPASPLHNPSEYVPDTPVASLFEITDKDDDEKSERPMAEQNMDEPRTPIGSSVEVREPTELQNENCEYVFLEDSSRKGEIMKDPASPLHNPSEYVPDTPVASLFEITDKDDDEKSERPMAEQNMDGPRTPIGSSVEVREPTELQNENCEYMFLEDSSKKDEIRKDPAPNPPENVLKTLVVSSFVETDKDDVGIAEIPIAEPIIDSPKTPTMLSVGAREENQLRSANYEPGVIENSSKKDEILNDPASLLANPSEYVPETPVVSLSEMTDKDDSEKAEKPDVEGNIGTPKTPIMSSVEAREPNQLQKESCEYVPETSSSVSVPEVVPGTNCEVEKCVLSVTDNCGYVSESPILPSEKLCNTEAVDHERTQVDMQIDETKEVDSEEKQGPVNIVVNAGTLDGDSAKVSSGDRVISDIDDEGYVDKGQVKDEMPRKKRRRVTVVPEGPRRVTRSSLRSSNA